MWHSYNVFGSAENVYVILDLTSLISCFLPLLAVGVNVGGQRTVVGEADRGLTVSSELAEVVRGLTGSKVF